MRRHFLLSLLFIHFVSPCDMNAFKSLIQVASCLGLATFFKRPAATAAVAAACKNYKSSVTVAAGGPQTELAIATIRAASRRELKNSSSSPSPFADAAV